MIVRVCATKGAFEVLPEKKMLLNFDALKKRFTIIIETPFVLIMKDAFEVNCKKNGILLVKHCENAKDAEEQAEKIYEVAA